MKSVALLFTSLMFASAVLAAEGPAPAAAKPDLAAGEALSNKVCAACHSNDGSRGSPANPILQGQHAEYIIKQLGDFKAGRRSNPIMSGMAAPLSDADIRNVAAFYESKSAKPGFAKHKDSVAQAEKIYRGGIADRSIPACAGCHGPNGAGMPAQYPRIGGQQSDYTEAQLAAFRGGTRGNSAPMAGVAAKLNDREIKALADYLTGLH